ncbi:hypothetical protein BD413DRAFT_508860 [Trametes elegans]|nr:hypothetical protein BD413DRAFT_508860 [Trametes elegans]
MPKDDPDSSSYGDTEPYQTQFIPGDNDEEELWEATEILEERGSRYKVRWAGVDPETDKPWAPSWVPKHDCTDDLIAEWKRKQKEKKKKAEERKKRARARSSITSTKGTKRSESTSTTATTRQSRGNMHIPTPSTSTRPPSHASSSHAVLLDKKTSKRRRADDELSPILGPDHQYQHDHEPGPSDRTTALASRPRKKRKVEVEVVRSRPSTTRNPNHEVVADKGKRKMPAHADEDDAEVNLHPEQVKEGRQGRSDTETSAVVPLTKIGPPRRPKPKRDDLGAVPARGSSGRKRPLTGQPTRQHSDRLDDERSHDGSTSRVQSGQRDNGVSNSHTRASVQPLNSGTAIEDLMDVSDSDDEELPSPPFLEALKRAKHRSPSNRLSANVRQLLAREEEENTQEAADIAPSLLSSPKGRASSLGSKREQHTPPRSPTDSNAKAGPSKPTRSLTLQGRPSANDTFSREGIVPATQPSPHTTPTHQQSLSPPLDAHDTNRPPPKTPPQAHSAQQASISKNGSIKSGMKRKGAPTKALRPVPSVSPSVFRPYLPSADVDEIEDFSSPEKETRKKRRAPHVSTQDTIELAVFTQDHLEMDVNSFMDWDGGAQLDEDPFPPERDGLELSLGPNLLPPDQEDVRRKAMASVLEVSRFSIEDRTPHSRDVGGQRPTSRQSVSKEAMASPEVPILQEPPPTSTTQRAEADSQSQLVLEGQIIDLNTALEEKDEQLRELELQLEKLETCITTLEDEKAKEATRFEAELKALREAADEKSEQITQLESQLVELQLQVTQLTSERDNDRERFESQVRELNESLEERNEQVSQLEGALVELQSELAETIAENERLLAAAQEQSAAQDDHLAQLGAAQERATTLEEELTGVRGQLSKAEEEATALTARLEGATQEWERRLKYAESDRDLFKDLYSEASTHASRLAKENAELEERARLAEGQVQDGLAMIRGTFEQQARRLREEAERWQAQYKLLRTRDERTDDEVRARAALEPQLRAENERLRGEAEILRGDMEKMASIIAQMSDERARTGGGEDADADADVEGGVSPPSAQAGANESSSYERGLAGSPRGPTESQGAEDELVYLCQHVAGAWLCNETFASAEAVVEHALQTHYSGADPGDA